MSRRLLGPVGGPVVFFLVAGLVFAGLGWVTYMALRVEHAQREAASRAEVGNNLRVALWRLDGRMLPALGVEDSRPFFHYDSADPEGPYGPAATPLLAATLPEWMKLHFQLDPAAGWRSNQAPDDAAEADRVRRAWPELPLQNLYGGREAALADLRAKFPARTTCDLFAARDRALPSNSLPLAAPLFAEVNEDSAPANPSPLPDPAPKPPPTETSSAVTNPKADTPDAVCVLGFELCTRPPEVQQQQIGNALPGNDRGDPDAANQLDNNSKKTEQAKAVPAPRQVQLSQGNVTPRSGRGQKGDEGDRGWADFVNRAQTIHKGLQESKQAYDDPFSRNPGNYMRNGAQLPGDQKFANPFVPVPPGANPATTSPTPTGAPTPPPATPPAAPGGAGGFVPPVVPAGPQTGRADTAADDKNRLAAKSKESDDLSLRRLMDEVARSDRPEREKQEAAKAAEALRKILDPDRKPAGWFAWPREAERSPEPAAPKPAPGEDRPAPVPAAVPAPPTTVHLGSLRPQWVTGPGGVEMLVLVRTAKFDDRTVYQGVVLDWGKLRAELQAGVQDLFPDARLVPVKDPDGVSPDRAMTALPVQLDPGPEPTLPPAGWTPLRIGLVLAWAAALIAVAAVGFGGWSLMDLAERRIRFVSAVTHELRTPLTSLRLYLDLLVSGMIQDEAKRQEYLNTLAAESDRLHRLIDNVLDYARLEKRRKDGDVKPVGVCDLLDQLRQTWTDRVARDGKELVVISTLPPGCEVATDAGMVQQIVGNLIDNARKYARDAADKRIWVWAKPAGRGVVLEVEDRGPGVPAGERKTIFKPFRRGEHADSTAGGAGLGLALAKSWAEVLGAKLTYRPADGGTGACFRLELPGK